MRRLTAAVLANDCESHHCRATSHTRAIAANFTPRIELIRGAEIRCRAVRRALSSEAMADRRVLDDGVGRYTAPDIPPDEPVEVGRYLDAFRRSKWLIALIVVSLTAAVLLISLLLPKTYRATSKIALDRVARFVVVVRCPVDPARPRHCPRSC